jgi:hypothetical protein
VPFGVSREGSSPPMSTCASPSCDRLWVGPWIGCSEVVIGSARRVSPLLGCKAAPSLSVVSERLCYFNLLIPMFL